MQRRLVQQGASQQTVGRLTQHFSGYVEAPRTSLEASKLRDMGVLQVNVNLSGQGNIAETMLKDPQAREQMSRFIGEEAMKASYAPGG